MWGLEHKPKKLRQCCTSDLGCTDMPIVLLHVMDEINNNNNENPKI
jgi:hypothetical protein